MNKATSSEYFSLRRGLLQDKISKAKSIEDHGQLSSLTARWVHRYGLESFDQLELQDLDKIGVQPIKELSQHKGLSLASMEVSEPSPLEISKTGPSEECHLHTLNRKTIKPYEERSVDDIGSTKLVNESNTDSVPQDTNTDLDRNLMQLETINAPAPPRPSISHFRRWLPSFDDGSRKAS